MYNITLLYLGAPTEPFYKQALEEYKKRLGRYCKFTEKCLKPEYLPQNPSDKDISHALAAEKEKILQALPKNAYKIALCVEGKQFSSEKLASHIDTLSMRGVSEIAFIIGSSFGLDESLKNECDLRLSMSPMTFIHSLAAVMLAEQIYRVFTILNGEKYHK